MHLVPSVYVSEPISEGRRAIEWYEVGVRLNARLVRVLAAVAVAVPVDNARNRPGVLTGMCGMRRATGEKRHRDQ